MKETVTTVADEFGGDYEQRQSTTNTIAKRLGRFAAKAAIYTGLGLSGGIALSTLVPTEVPFGPGTAKATVTVDGMATLDGGAIGNARRSIDGPSLGPIELGLKVRANEIPQIREVQSSSNVSRLSVSTLFEDFSERDVKRYGELYRSVSTQGDEITKEIRDHTLRLSLVSGLACMALYEIPGKRGRKHIKGALWSPKPLLILGLLGASIYSARPAPTEYDWQAVSSEYDGTYLEGAQVSGAPATELVNNFGQKIMKYVRVTDEFYDSVLETTKNELPGQTLLGQRPEDADNIVFLFFTDNHCNTGMPKTLAAVADAAGASLALDGGDTVMSGTGYEKYCVQQEVRPFRNRDIHLVEVPGNHDSEVIEGYLDNYGVSVLDGSVLEIGGLRILGDSDPRSSELGQGITYRGDETIADLGSRLADTACKETDPLILMVHDKRAANEALARGCVRLSLSGHTHAEEILSGTTLSGLDYTRITGGTSGGAKESELTYGPLGQASKSMLISVKDGVLQGYQDITITTEGGLLVGDIVDTRTN